MRLSAPLFRLKHKARLLSRKDRIPLHQALDRVAEHEGFPRWSLLVAKAAATTPAEKFFARLGNGDLVLVGARPGHGKTLMSVALMVEAMKAGHHGAFFTLEDTESGILDRLRAIGIDKKSVDGRFAFDSSDEISADYIATKLDDAPPGTLAVIDYLQLLDQRRENPSLTVQVHALRSFARERGLILVFISQIDRRYDASTKPCPDLHDVRLPNPLDLALFDKTCFLHQGAVRFATPPRPM